MPVYNGERFIAAAIQSIINQTWKDFELLIIDDGSTDQTAAIISTFQDPRIRYIPNGENEGIVYSRNKGLSLMSGKYYAPFDADDIAAPKKFEKQILFLEANPDFDMIGSWVRFIDQDGKLLQQKWTLRADVSIIKPMLLFRNYFTHSAVVIRKSSLLGISYRDGLHIGEDWQLYLDLLDKGKMSQYPEYLTFRRIHGHNVSEYGWDKNIFYEKKILKNQFEKYHIALRDKQLEILCKVRHGQKPISFVEIKIFEDILMEVISNRMLQDQFGRQALEIVVINRWIKLLLMTKGFLLSHPGLLFSTKIWSIHQITLIRKILCQ